MPTPWDDELARLEGERRETIETDPRAAMWRYAYCVASNATRALEQSVADLRLRPYFHDVPMIFFYPELDER
jgi:hypothetical protein